MTITAENLCKKYLINRQMSASYQTLREKISQLFSLSKKQKVQKEEFWALKDISFDINKGDRVAIIGRNGAGKSTLLKVLSRITPPTKGRALIKGRVSSLLEVGTGFHPELTGRENIYLNGSIVGMSHKEIKTKFDQIVDFADIEQFLDTPVKRYSSGMYVRLAFAVSAHLEPDILFIDEVLAVGDARFQKKCIGKMQEAAKEGRTILFVTHNMGTVGFCNKGILLEKGQIIPTANLQECIQHYHATSAATGLSWQGDVGDQNVRIYSFKIMAHDGAALFKKSGKGRIEVSFQVLKTIPDLIIGYFGYNKYGAQLLHYKIVHNDQAVFSVEPGFYTVKTELDFNLFAAGIFRLELDIGIHNIKRITTPDIQVQFEVFNEQKKYGEPENSIHPMWKSTLKPSSLHHEDR